MDIDLQLPSCGPKKDMLRRMAEHYPAMDLGALEVITQIKNVAKLHTSMVTRGLEQYDLTEARMYVLSNLIMHERCGEPAMSPSAISERLGITRATVTSLLDGLQESGYIVREHSGADRRAILVHVTDKARDFLDKFLSRGLPRLRRAMEFLSEADRRRMMEWLTTIESNLERENI